MRRAGNMPPSIRAPALPQLASTWATSTAGDPAPASPTASAAVIAELRGEIRTLRNREQAELLRAEMEAHRRSGGDGSRVSRARRGAAQLLARGALEAEDEGAYEADLVHFHTPPPKKRRACGGGSQTWRSGVAHADDY